MSVKDSIAAPDGDVGEQFLLEQVLGQGEEADPVIVPPEDVFFLGYCGSHDDRSWL